MPENEKPPAMPVDIYLPEQILSGINAVVLVLTTMSIDSALPCSNMFHSTRKSGKMIEMNRKKDIYRPI